MERPPAFLCRRNFVNDIEELNALTDFPKTCQTLSFPAPFLRAHARFRKNTVGFTRLLGSKQKRRLIREGHACPRSRNQTFHGNISMYGGCTQAFSHCCSQRRRNNHYDSHNESCTLITEVVRSFAVRDQLQFTFLHALLHK